MRDLHVPAGNLIYATIVLYSTCFLSIVGLNAQHPENYFQPAAMKRDLVWLQRKILLYHPACRDSIRYDSVNAAFEIAFYEAEKPLQELPFLRLLRQTLMSLRCGHTTAIPSKSFYRYFEKARPKPLFPLQIICHDSSMQVRFNGSDDPGIKVGDVITSVNQEPADDLTNSLLGILPADGYHDSFRKYQLSLNFPSYYLFLRGPYYYFQTEITDSSGRKNNRTLSLRSHGKPVSRVFPNRSTKVLMSDSRDRELSFLRASPSVACLKISRFKGKSGWYKKVFQRLEKGNFQTLILDLRGNSGGNMLEANQLLTFLLPDTFSMKFIRRQGPFLFNGRGNLGLRERLSMALFRIFPTRPGKRAACTWKEGELWSTRYFYKPAQDYNFKGKIIVLMDGGTFSSASYIAAKLRKAGRAILAGDESGGGARGFNAIIVPTLTLPETRLRVYLPLYYLDQEMPDATFRGLQPDLPLAAPNPAMLLRGLDSEIENLIRSIRNPSK
jgi:hypothetical protein